MREWTFPSDWKPEPDQGGLEGWEPVFHPAVSGDFVYVPGASGTVWQLNRSDGSIAALLSPFDYFDPNRYVAGPLTVDPSGRIVYNVIQLDPVNPWVSDVAGAWLVAISPDGTAASVSFGDLVPDAPAVTDDCYTTFGGVRLPWPPSPDAVPITSPCGSQRPGINIAPAVSPDGTIYTVSRAHHNARYGYLIAVNPDLTAKWDVSLRDRLNDGCDVTLPPSGTPGGCRAGSTRGVDPATNQAPAGQVLDVASSTPVVAPDGSILFGVLTRYNYDRGHMFKFDSEGNFVGAYDFGWDTTPAVYTHDGTYSIVLKDNHYDVGSYCDNRTFCPPGDANYNITQISADLGTEWEFQSPDGFEWCINAPAVDANGTVYANSEDGNLYVIGQGGTLVGNIFLEAALGSAYTPVSIGGDGKIYTQNDGHLFVVGQADTSGEPPASTISGADQSWPGLSTALPPMRFAAP